MIIVFLGELSAMRELGKMAELKFEAPLAKFEETDDYCDYISNQNSLNDTINYNLKEGSGKDDKMLLLEQAVRDAHISKSSGIVSPNCNSILAAEMSLGLDVGTAPGEKGSKENADNFNETFGGSLEDLVNTFDEKITKCFGNFEENIEELAPVQVRSQDEIMNECQ